MHHEALLRLVHQVLAELARVRVPHLDEAVDAAGDERGAVGAKASRLRVRLFAEFNGLGFRVHGLGFRYTQISHENEISFPSNIPTPKTQNPNPNCIYLCLCGWRLLVFVPPHRRRASEQIERLTHRQRALVLLPLQRLSQQNLGSV